MNDELAKSIVYISVNLEVQDYDCKSAPAYHHDSHSPNAKAFLITATRGICPPPDNKKFQDWFWLKSKRNPTQQMLREHYQGFVFGLMTVTTNRLEQILDSDGTWFLVLSHTWLLISTGCRNDP